MQSSLRDKLLAIQQDRDWSDREMAAALRINRARWQQIRAGSNISMGRKVLDGVAKAFPELFPEIMAEIANGK